MRDTVASKTTRGPSSDPVPPRVASRSDAGFLSVEFVVAASFILLVVLIVVGWGRLSYSRGEVEKAAAAAARAATETSTPSAASDAAHRAAQEDLAAAGVSCTQFAVDVDTAQFRPGGQVTVTVSCTAKLSDVMMAGFPCSKTMTSSSTSPLEQLRDLGPGTIP